MKPQSQTSSKARRPSALAQAVAHPAFAAVAVTIVAALYRAWVWKTYGGGTVEGIVQGAPFADSEGWHDLATQFAEGRIVNEGWTLSWSARRPFYYFFMGAFHAVFGSWLTVTRAVHFCISSVSAGLLFDATRRLAPVPVALSAALLHAFLQYDAEACLTPLTEPLGYFLANLSFWAFVVGAQRWLFEPDTATPLRWIAASGFLLGLANLTRPLNLLAAATLPLVVMALARRRRPEGFCWRRELALPAALVLGVALALGPWMARQRMVHGIWTLSENTAEVMFAASSPKFGVWVSAVSSLPPPGTIAERVRFYNEEVRKNLAEHPGFYAANALSHARKAASDTAHHRRALVLTLVLVIAWLASTGTSPPGRWFWPGALGALTVTLIAPKDALCLWWVAGTALALKELAPVLLLPAALIPSVLTLGSMAMSRDPRLTHSLEWLALATAAWLMWRALGRARGQTAAELDWESAEGYARRSWGLGARPVLWLGAAFGVVFLAGLARATAANLDPRPKPVLEPVAASEAQEWVGRVLGSEGGVHFAHLASKLVVRRAAMRRDSAMRFGANQPFRHWYGLFQPRPYAFTIFKTHPNQPETRVVFPGLPELAGGEPLVLIGVPLGHPERGESLELLGVARPRTDGKAAAGLELLLPDGATARIHAAYIDAVIADAEKKAAPRR